MASQRLYKCQQCGMIYRGHELTTDKGPLPPFLAKPCPTPGCRGTGLFGQGTPGEAALVQAIVLFPIALIVCHWVVGLGWAAAAAAALATSFFAWVLSRWRHQPGSRMEDQHFAAHELSERAEALHRAGKAAMARYAYQRAADLLGPDVDRKLEAAIVGRLANVERELGDFANAQTHYLRALHLAEQIHDISGMINRHNNLGVLFGDDLRNPLGALDHVVQALALARQINEPERIARMLIHMAKRLREAHRLDEADTNIRKALDVVRSSRQNELLPEALHERACLRMAQHQNALAEADLQEALRQLGPQSSGRLGQHVRRALETVRAAISAGEHVTIGPPGEQATHTDLPFDLDLQASKVLDPGMQHMLAGRLDLAIDAIQEALDDSHVKNDLKASTLARSNLGDMLHTVGRNIEAERVLRQALADAEKTGISFLEQSARLNLGLVLHTKGAWAECRDCLLRALTLAGQKDGSRDAGRIHLALGNLFRDTADYRSAEDHYAQADRLAKQHDDRELEGSVYQSQGNMHFKQRQWTLAQSCYEKARAIAERTRDGRLQGMVFHMLGNVLRRLGRPEEALVLLQQSLSMAEFCPTQVGRAGRLNDLAVVEQQLQRALAAREHYQQGVDIYRRLGLTSPEIAGCLQNLGVLLIRAGEVPAGRDCILEAAEMDNSMIAQAFGISSEDARLEFLDKAKRRLDDVVSLVARGGPCEGEAHTVAACADVVIRRKGASLEALAIQRDLAASGKHAKLTGILERLREVRMALAQMTLAGKAFLGGRYTSEAAQLADEKRRLEQQAAQEIPDIALDEQLRRSDRRAIALALPEGCVLAEFVRFGFFPYPPADQPPSLGPDRYAAFIIWAARPDNVEFIDLGEAGPIDQMIADFRASVTGERERGLGAAQPLGPEDAMDLAGAGLRAAVFDPLATALGDHSSLLLAPDGDLTRLPFEALPTGRGRRLIDQYHMTYVAAARDVLRFGKQTSHQPTAPVVAADPDFDLASSAEGVKPAPATRKPGQTPRRRSQDMDRDMRFDRLPGTRSEGQHIAEMLGVQPWLQGCALEARLKQVRSPRILHLATHGFFLQNQKHDSNAIDHDLGVSSGQESLRGSRLENPLLRSGMALAGVNTWLSGGQTPDEAEDGMLTAEDVTGMDLLDTELVVLSACETGLGEVHMGEGVMGLRRSFALTGAKTLVMSLWKVPDQETQELMEDFYRRILAGEPKAEALRHAQLGMKERHPHPFHWGAFICQGEPGALAASGDSVIVSPEAKGRHDGSLD